MTGKLIFKNLLKYTIGLPFMAIITVFMLFYLVVASLTHIIFLIIFGKTELIEDLKFNLEMLQCMWMPIEE